jgi:hypothetical protein
MPDGPTAAAARQEFRRALAAASPHVGNPASSLEAPARAYARAQREAGLRIEAVLQEAKYMLVEETGINEPVLKPRVIGWIVAGYFAGT